MEEVKELANTIREMLEGVVETTVPVVTDSRHHGECQVQFKDKTLQFRVLGESTSRPLGAEILIRNPITHESESKGFGPADELEKLILTALLERAAMFSKLQRDAVAMAKSYVDRRKEE